ncbi:putative transferase CAF17 homolog, mitochondrial [Aricia agestis]|uniref:putative transferase CAF17 homolog, mitochondrial n=1 Tax=Aricia agestis TaxID=91739 RepID=UPI001C2062B3|nr:putative transferase CAF17 homolog, mitochondrial [Aricia agestis]
MNSPGKVKGFFRIHHFVQQVKRYLHNNNASKNNVLYPLSRGLLRLKGEDTSGFLQGLITNDMRHFETGSQSIYAMFLNNKGRVLYDTLIHKWDSSESFLVECDPKVINLLEKHLKMFKLRRNVTIEDISKSFNVWAITIPTADVTTTKDNKINIYKDPRLADLGFRIVASNTLKDSQVADIVGGDISIERNENGYKYLRYKLGVSEGAADLPPGSSFPLEINCDYLHGVSFHKGCYIGQEVTARVHHTGVVRKRIMPLKFSEPISEEPPLDTNIVAANKPAASLGKLKGVMRDYGIGLIRIKESLEAKTVKINNYTAEPFKPMWWPLEAPKEIAKSTETI